MEYWKMVTIASLLAIVTGCAGPVGLVRQSADGCDPEREACVCGTIEREQTEYLPAALGAVAGAVLLETTNRVFHLGIDSKKTLTVGAAVGAVAGDRFGNKDKQFVQTCHRPQTASRPMPTQQQSVGATLPDCPSGHHWETNGRDFKCSPGS